MRGEAAAERLSAARSRRNEITREIGLGSQSRHRQSCWISPVERSATGIGTRVALGRGETSYMLCLFESDRLGAGSIPRPVTEICRPDQSIAPIAIFPLAGAAKAAQAIGSRSVRQVCMRAMASF